MLGASRLEVKCQDGKDRMARVPGKLRKRVWMRQGDIVIVVPWDFQDSKADVIWRYTGPQVGWLKRNGYI